MKDLPRDGAGRERVVEGEGAVAKMNEKQKRVAFGGAHVKGGV